MSNPTRRAVAAQLLTAAVLVPLLARSAQAASHAASHEVRIKGMKFNPAELTVAVGDKVVFMNEDGAPHTATAEDGSFDTGRLARGASAEVTIAAAGTSGYFCAIHRSMKGTISAA